MKKAVARGIAAVAVAIGMFLSQLGVYLGISDSESTAVDQLTERYEIKKILRDLWHLCHRPIRKVLSHTIVVWINLIHGQQPTKFPSFVT